MKISKTEHIALMRADLPTFIVRCVQELDPGTIYQHNWHIDLIGAMLADMRVGQHRRLVINLPPRNLKSLCVSVAYTAWLLGHDPTTKIITASDGQGLSSNLAAMTRQVMISDWYRELFPGTILRRDDMALAELVTTAGGYRLSTSVGGVLTGRGADYIIIDDPQKPDEALSETERENVNNWFDQSLVSRLNNKATGKIVLVMQRLHENDLTGHVMERAEWTHLRLPAIAEVEETIRVRSFFGDYDVRRKVGDSLHAERESLEVLLELKKQLGEYAFAGQYQQSPVPVGGGIVKRDWLQFCDAYERPEEFDFIVHSWDTASKKGELNSFSVCTIWGCTRKDRRVYLLHVLRAHLSYQELKLKAQMLCNMYEPTKIVIEEKASGIQLAQELPDLGIRCVETVIPKGDKVMRMHAQTGHFEGYKVFLPRLAPWLHDYVSELTTFPYSKHSDQVDSTSQALLWITEKMRRRGFFDFDVDTPTEPPAPPRPMGYLESLQRMRRGGW